MDALGLRSAKNVYHLADQGRLRPMRVGRRTVYSPYEVADLAEEFAPTYPKASAGATLSVLSTGSSEQTDSDLMTFNKRSRSHSSSHIVGKRAA